MGNLIRWNDTPESADFDRVKIFRSNDIDGIYAEIDNISVTEGVYYDYNGVVGQYYKIQFLSTGSGYLSEFSDPFEAGRTNLYTDYDSVMRTAGLTDATTPDSLTLETIYEWVYDISRNIDKASKTVYGRTEDFEEIFSSGNELNPSFDLKLPYKNVVVSNVQFRLGYEDETFTSIRNHYDFEAEPKGLLHLYRYPYLGYNRYNDIKVTGSYGLLDVPSEVEQLCKIMVAIRIFVHITGGSYNDVTSYSLGEFNESLGEPYTNLRASIDMLKKEQKRLMDATGISYKRYNMRLA